MQEFTKVQRGWLIHLLGCESENLRDDLECSGVSPTLVKCQCEKYENMANKFQKTLDTKGKRIAIKY